MPNTNREVQMFGETVEAMEQAKPAFINNIMYATMILSDAQEEIAQGNYETARQYINKAKYFMTKYIKDHPDAI